MTKITSLHVLTLAGLDLFPGALFEDRPQAQKIVITELLLSGFIEIKGLKYRPTDKGRQFLIEFKILIQREILSA
jgi:hypothetical protein